MITYYKVYSIDDLNKTINTLREHGYNGNDDYVAQITEYSDCTYTDFPIIIRISTFKILDFTIKRYNVLSKDTTHIYHKLSTMDDTHINTVAMNISNYLVVLFIIIAVLFLLYLNWRHT